eukprot:m.443173 g.443173  ORF g.443173 m.443173 type:complete len:452 (+) comp56820_c0_seq2:137-1492(+)
MSRDAESVGSWRSSYGDVPDRRRVEDTLTPNVRASAGWVLLCSAYRSSCDVARFDLFSGVTRCQRFINEDFGRQIFSDERAMTVLTVGESGMQALDTTTLGCERTLKCAAKAAALSEDAKKLAVCVATGVRAETDLVIFSARTFKRLQSWHFQFGFSDINFLEGGQQLLLVTADPRGRNSHAIIWDLAEGTELRRFPVGIAGRTRPAVLPKQPLALFADGRDPDFSVWNFQTASLVFRIPCPNVACFAVAKTKDLFVTLHPSIAALRSSLTFEVLWSVRLQMAPYNSSFAKFDPLEETLIVGGDSTSPLLLSVDSGEILQKYAQFSGKIVGAVFQARPPVDNVKRAVGAPPITISTEPQQDPQPAATLDAPAIYLDLNAAPDPSLATEDPALVWPVEPALDAPGDSLDLGAAASSSAFQPQAPPTSSHLDEAPQQLVLPGLSLDLSDLDLT